MEAGLIRESEKRVDPEMGDERRVYYQMTGEGQAARWRKDDCRMAPDMAIRRYRAWYAVLLQLYSRPFHERFGEGLEQTFPDLCRDRRGAKRRLFPFALWMFLETLAGTITERTARLTDPSRTILRAAMVTLCPLVLHADLALVELNGDRVIKGWVGVVAATSSMVRTKRRLTHDPRRLR